MVHLSMPSSPQLNSLQVKITVTLLWQLPEEPQTEDLWLLQAWEVWAWSTQSIFHYRIFPCLFCKLLINHISLLSTVLRLPGHAFLLKREWRYLLNMAFPICTKQSSLLIFLISQSLNNPNRPVFFKSEISMFFSKGINCTHHQSSGILKNFQKYDSFQCLMFP